MLRTYTVYVCIYKYVYKNIHKNISYTFLHIYTYKMIARPGFWALGTPKGKVPEAADPRRVKQGWDMSPNM